MKIGFNASGRCLVLFALLVVQLLPGCGKKVETVAESVAAKASTPQSTQNKPAQAEAITGVPSHAAPAEGGPPNEPAIRMGIAPTTASPTSPRRESAERSSSAKTQIADCYNIRPEDVPLAPMGDPPGSSPLTKAPGYYPPNDPEAAAARTGRRIAPKVDIPFTGGESSPERLAIAIIDGLRNSDFNALRALRVTPDEFADIMWREFPESRPICNSDVSTAYFYLDRECHSGISLGLSEWGGQDLRLLGVTYSIGRAPYTNFTLYRGVQIHVLQQNGEEAVLKFVRTFAERNGIWKVYAYKDKG